MRKTNKIISSLAALLVSTSVFSSMKGYASGVPDPDTAVAENYWAEIEKDNSIYGGVYPKYLMKLQESVLKNSQLSVTANSPSTGIYKNVNTLTYMRGADIFDELSQPELIESINPSGDPNFQDGKYHNPFNFDFATDFIRTRDQLNVYGDIAVNGNTQNNAVATHKVGEKLNLDFSVDLSNFSKWQNIRFWGNINGPSARMEWKTNGTEGYRATDAELLFILNIPQGVSVPDTAQISVTGLPNFSVKKEIIDGKVVIRLRKIQETKGYMTAQEYYALLKQIKKVTVSINGLLVEDTVATNKNLSITGSIVGVQDELSTDSKTIAINKNGSGPNDARAAYFFAAKQSSAGRDSSVTADKQNLISYTFKVDKSTNEAPVLKVKDATINKGENLDLMSLVVSATDKEDGDLTNKVKLVDNGGFDKDKVGKYIVTFKVTDKDGASTTAKSTVMVIEKVNNNNNNNNNNNGNNIDNNGEKPFKGKLSNTGISTDKGLYYGAWFGLLVVLGVTTLRKRKKED